MKEKSRIIYLVLIMTALVFAVSGVTFYTQYQAAIKEELKWLTYTVQTQARLIEAVAGFDAKYSAQEKDYPEGPFAATLSQVEAAHKSLIGFGKTGEFTLGKREGDKIVFLLSHRHSESGLYHSIPFNSGMAEPMRRALLGQSGSGILIDYQGATVLAAYEPVAVLNIGIVAKMDIDEIRKPFIRAGLKSAAVTILLIAFGSASFIHLTNPLLNNLKKSEEQIRLLLNSTGEAIYGLDLQGNCIFVNPACLRMLGYEDASQVIGKNMRDLIHPAQKDGIPCEEKTCKMYQAVLNGKETHEDGEVFRRADGTVFPVEYWSRPIRKDDKIMGAVITFVDITERKRAEEELHQAKEAAENATKLKDKFVFLVAHNLKNPFTAIQGFLQLILKDKEDPVSEKHADKLRRIHKSCVKLHNMLEELLSMSRIHSGAIRPIFKFIYAHTLIDAAIENYSGLAQKKGIKLINMSHEGVRLHADPRLLEEVVANLVSNAIKFCSEGDEITVFIPTVPKATIAVKDTGTGIKKELLPHLFKEEVKTTTAGTDGEKGTGLGLPYSFEIMKAQGGRLYVESAEGKGSVFYAQLPDIKPRVLIVDDEAAIRKLISIYLEPLDVQVSEADSGKRGLEILGQIMPHVIITDIGMPGMDGFEFLERVKQDQNSKDIPMIVITGDNEIQTREKSFHLGANDFIAKPLAMEDIIPRVKRYIG